MLQQVFVIMILLVLTEDKNMLLGHLYMLNLFDICHFYSLYYFHFAPGKWLLKQSVFFQSVLNRFPRNISMNFKHAKYWTSLEHPGRDKVSLPKIVINVYIPFSCILAITAILKWLILSRISVWVLVFFDWFLIIWGNFQ